MEQSWLVRTASREIIGPMTKAKILELLKNKTLTPKDEIASENGFWFYIKEKELLDKYLHGDEIQPSDPVSNVPNILSTESSEKGFQSSPNIDDTFIMNVQEEISPDPAPTRDSVQETDPPLTPEPEEPEIQEPQSTSPPAPATVEKTNGEKEKTKYSKGFLLILAVVLLACVYLAISSAIREPFADIPDIRDRESH